MDLKVKREPQRKRTHASTELPFDTIALAPPGGTPPEELILLLHGFAETGERLLRKLAPAIEAARNEPPLLERTLVLAPNAPFLMPHKTERGYGATYSWYFYSPENDEYVIDMAPATEFLRSGLERLGLLALPKRIIGFSQGGFLAPVAAPRLGSVRQLIAIGTEILVDEIPGGIPAGVPYRVDQIHGAQDTSVNPEAARRAHDRLMAAGVAGSFELLRGVGHPIEENVRNSVIAALGRLNG
jgi:predicted esterase